MVKLLVTLLMLLMLPINLSAEILYGKTYYEKILPHIQQAKSSIDIAMYFVIINDRPDNPINNLVDELITAQKRGVRVKVVLEDGKFKENKLAFIKLRDNNIPVFFDTPEFLLHLKAVVIDNQYVFSGSANWSAAAILRNHEATSYYESAIDGQSLSNYINNIPVQNGDIFLQKEEGIRISSTFLTAAKKGRKLLTSQAAKQFDLYLLLLKYVKDSGRYEFAVDYEELAKQMGYQAPADLGRYNNAEHYFYEKIHRPLNSLKKSGLMAYEKKRVTLKPHKTFNIPHKFYDKKLFLNLSMKAKYLYLICSYEAAKSTRYPEWFRSQKDMEKKYGISDTTISEGLLELEKAGLIQITRDKPTPPDFSDRLANIYRMLVLK